MHVSNRTSSLLVVFSLQFMVVAGSLAAGRDPYVHFFDDTFGDFSEELETARDSGKQGILIFFEMDECPFCQRMKQTVLNQPRVQAWYKERFLIFSVDTEGETEITDFEGNVMPAKDFAFRVNRVRATPVFAFFDLKGNRITRFTGATKDAQEFLWLGEFVTGGHYKATNFTRFKRQKRTQTGSPR